MKAIELLVNAGLTIEKARVQAQVRKSHLQLNGRDDDLTNELFMRVDNLEKWVDDQVASLIKEHPSYPWFSKVKGIGRENIAKVIAQVDIERADTISALWKYCGFGVENGHAPKPCKGKKLEYNKQLRTLCWRVGQSLRRAKGKFYAYYLDEKARYEIRFETQGKQIVEAAKLPKKNGKHYEPDSMISKGHVDNMAMRKMIKLFLACLWLAWRELEGLPVTKPYAIDIMGHSNYTDPWTMTDKKGAKKNE